METSPPAPRRIDDHAAAFSLSLLLLLLLLLIIFITVAITVIDIIGIVLALASIPARVVEQVNNHGRGAARRRLLPRPQLPRRPHAGAYPSRSSESLIRVAHPSRSSESII